MLRRILLNNMHLIIIFATLTYSINSISEYMRVSLHRFQIRSLYIKCSLCLALGILLLSLSVESYRSLLFRVNLAALRWILGWYRLVAFWFLRLANVLIQLIVSGFWWLALSAFALSAVYLLGAQHDI